MYNMSKILILCIFSITINLLFGAPYENRNEIPNDELLIAQKTIYKNFRATIKNIFTDGARIVDSLENYLKQILQKLNENSSGTAELRNKIEKKYVKTLEAIQHYIGKNATTKVVEYAVNIKTYLKSTNVELAQLIGDIKPNVDRIGESILNTFNEVSNNMSNIFNSLLTRIDKVFENEKKEA